MITGEGNEPNTEQTEAQVDANAGIAGAENQGEIQTAEVVDTPPSWQEQALNHAKEQGREVSSFEELLKPIEVEKEVVKEVNPYADILDDDDKAYFQFKKETGKSRKEFEAVNKNWDEVPAIELAREKVRKENPGLTLDDSQVDDYLQDELGLDFSDLDTNGQIKLNKFAQDLRNEKKAEQDKYRQPLENKQESPQTQPAGQPEYVKLPNGALMGKAEFEAAQKVQQENVKLAVEAVKTVKTADFKISVDDNGSVRDVAIPYEYSENDVQNMASIVCDIDGTIAKRYSSEYGFNHASFGEDMLWSDRSFREKAIPDLISRERAKAIEETLQLVGNHNYKPGKDLHKQTAEGVRIVPFNQLGQ